MSGATVEDLKTWVAAMMKKMLITNYKMNISGSVTKGDGYLGEVTFIKVIAFTNESIEEVYDLVIKSAKKGDELRKTTPIQDAYNRYGGNNVFIENFGMRLIERVFTK